MTINERLGKRLIDLLSLNLIESTYFDGPRVATSWGTKTPKGLGATVRRIMREIELEHDED